MIGSKNVTANFAINPANTFTLTAIALNGTVTKSPNQLTYNNGTIVALTADAAKGYHFTGWSGNLSGTTNPINITMNGNKTVTANFAANKGPAPVDLGTAGNFVILAKSAVSNTGTSSVVGNIGVSPAAATFITGFGLIADATNIFSTSSLVTGKVYASNYAVPTPNNMTTAIGDMETAYTDAAGRTLPDHTELGAGDISGLTLAPGLYKWGTDLQINTDVTLSGSSNDVWIFQVAGNLTMASAKAVVLIGGAQAKNIFWQVAGHTSIGTTADFKGNILCQTAIILRTGAKLNGRALAQTAVTLDSNDVVKP
jgi:uncharacterized repeat protein (TIGR02543 family)